MTTAVTTAFSFATDPDAAVVEIRQQLAAIRVEALLFFCASSLPLPALTHALQAHFKDSVIYGCTSAGEISQQGYGPRALVAIAFHAEYFQITPCLVEKLSEGGLDDVPGKVTQLLQQPMLQPAGQRFALTLVDGLSTFEEQILAAFSLALGSVPQLGISAGGPDGLSATAYVCINGTFYTDAAVLLLIESRCDFQLFSHHHFQPRRRKLVVTDACQSQRRVRELDAMPAAQAYAEMLGLTVDQLNETVFALNPLAVRLGDQHYVRAIQRCNEDGSLTFYAAIETGVILTRMQREDMRQSLQRWLQQIEQELGPAQLVLGFDCLLRRREAQALHQEAALSELFRRFRVIGLNTYGEHYNGMVFNQTFTGIAIGQPTSYHKMQMPLDRSNGEG